MPDTVSGFEASERCAYELSVFVSAFLCMLCPVPYSRRDGIPHGLSPEMTGDAKAGLGSL